MPNIESAKKRMRQTARKTEVNRARRSRIRTFIKKIDLTKFNDDYYFAIDPIDGTKNYIKKNENFCTMVSLIFKKRPIACFIYYPLINKYLSSFEYFFQKRLPNHYAHEMLYRNPVYTPGLRSRISLAKAPRLKDCWPEHQHEFIRIWKFRVEKWSYGEKVKF